MMPGPTLNAGELAAELGRHDRWLYEHWRRLVADDKMPAPMHGAASPLVWNRAHIYAWLDRALTREQRATAAAFRAAAHAAADSRLTAASAHDDAEWRVKLDQQYAGGGTR